MHILKTIRLNRLMEKQRNCTLSTKILEGYLIIILLFFCLLFFLLSYFLHNYINENVYANMLNHNQQVENSLNYLLDDIVRLSEYPYTDGEVLDILRKEYSEDNSAQIEMVNDISTLNSLIYKHVFYMNKYIDSVWLIPANGSGPAVKMVGSVNNNFDVTAEDWYPKVRQGDGSAFILGVHQDHGNNYGGEIVSVARSILDPENEKYLGMIVINMSVQKISALWHTADSDGSVTVVADEKENLIMYGKTGTNSAYNEYLTEHLSQISLDQISKAKINGENYYIAVSETEALDGKIFSIYEQNTVISSFRTFMLGVIFSAIILGAALIYISFFISKSITKPIKKLVTSMKAVEAGNLEEKSEEFHGELKILSNSFNQMTAQMANMFSQLQEKEKQKRLMEFQALQAQINPHFMYNTLSSIKCMAELQGAESIVNMLDAMVHILRYATENTSEIVSIEQEVTFIKNYMKIINFRNFGRFSFILQVPEETFSYGTLRFILQPIVENSIFHGFDPEDLNAVIELKVLEKEDTVVFEVSDTGRGMPPELCREILEHGYNKKKGLNKIGIYNVDQRIKLTFGKEYGIRIISQPGCFTKCMITIPKIKICDFGGDADGKEQDSINS